MRGAVRKAAEQPLLASALRGMAMPEEIPAWDASAMNVQGNASGVNYLSPVSGAQSYSAGTLTTHRN